MKDPRREALLGLILEWDPAVATIHDHLGMTLEQWLKFRATGDIPRDYEPRQPAESEADPATKQGRPIGRQISDATKAQIRRLHERGVSGHQIARELHVSQSTVQLAIAKARATATKEAS